MTYETDLRKIHDLIEQLNHDRNQLAWKARNEGGLTWRAIAHSLGMTENGIRTSLLRDESIPFPPKEVEEK